MFRHACVSAQVSFAATDVSAPNVYFHLRCGSTWCPTVFLVVLDVEEGIASAEVGSFTPVPA